jgi:hypothetical protein
MIAESPGSFYLVNKHSVRKDSTSSRTPYVIPLQISVRTDTQITNGEDPGGISTRE